MIAEHWIHISVAISLTIVTVSLTLGIVASLATKKD